MARARGLNPGTVHSRLQWGWSLQRALSTPPIEPCARGMPPQPNSIAGLARQAGLGEATVRWRIKQGWPTERVFSQPEKHEGVATICEKFNVTPVVSITSVENRMKRGQSFLDATLTPPSTRIQKARVTHLRRRENIEAVHRHLTTHEGLKGVSAN